MARKVFVQVSADFDVAGRIHPRAIVWEDGRTFPIDRVLDVRPAPSLKVGGCGMRYTCRIRGQETYLYLDGSQWFMEGKDAKTI